MRISRNYKQQSTHMLTLLKAINATDGDVCEVGVGFSSTPFIHWMSQQKPGREVVSYENDKDWHKFAKSFRSQTHKIRLADPDFGNVDYKRHWGVVFIDHSPQPRLKHTRGDDAMKFEDADLIVLHDTEPESYAHYGYPQVFKKYKYHYTWKKCKPWVSIVSNKIDVSKWQD